MIRIVVKGNATLMPKIQRVVLSGRNIDLSALLANITKYFQSVLIKWLAFYYTIKGFFAFNSILQELRKIEINRKECLMNSSQSL